MNAEFHGSTLFPGVCIGRSQYCLWQKKIKRTIIEIQGSGENRNQTKATVKSKIFARARAPFQYLTLINMIYNHFMSHWPNQQQEKVKGSSKFSPISFSETLLQRCVLCVLNMTE